MLACLLWEHLGECVGLSSTAILVPAVTQVSNQLAADDLLAYMYVCKEMGLHLTLFRCGNGHTA